MDLATLQQRARAARQVAHTIEHPMGAIVWRMLVPTQHEVLLASHRTQALAGGADRSGLLVLQRAVLEAAIVGWEGARVGHVLPADAEAQAPLPWEMGAVPVLLDALPDQAQELADVLNQHMAKRTQALEADAKN